MSSPQARESDIGLLLAVLALLAVALTLGYAPWVLASIPLATSRSATAASGTSTR